MQAERGRIAVWLRVCAWCVHDLDGICLMKIIPSSLSCPGWRRRDKVAAEHLGMHTAGRSCAVRARAVSRQRCLGPPRLRPWHAAITTRARSSGGSNALRLETAAAGAALNFSATVSGI